MNAVIGEQVLSEEQWFQELIEGRGCCSTTGEQGLNRFGLLFLHRCLHHLRLLCRTNQPKRAILGSFKTAEVRGS